MHPVMFKVFGLDVYSYGVMLVFAFLVCLFIAIKRGERKNVKPDFMLDLSLYLLIFGALGARFFYVIQNLNYYLTQPLLMLNFRQGGLSWHGAVIGGISVIWFFCKKKGVSPALILDIFAPTFMLGLGIGRIGCLLNGCCFGRFTNAPWAFAIPSTNSLNPRHPTQIYELMLDVIGFFLLLYWERFTKFKGELFWVYIIMYSVVRFTIEIWRESESLIFHLSLAQVVSIILIIISSIIIWYNRKHIKTDVTT